MDLLENIIINLIKNMKKILAKLVIVSLLAVSFVLPATTNAVAPNWNTTGNYVVSFEYLGSYYNHDMVLSQNGLGEVTGNGGYPAGGPFAYAWMIDTGSMVSANSIHLNTHYTLGAVCSMTIDGTVSLGGTMSGTWSDDCSGPRTGSWSTISGNAAATTMNTVIVNPGDMALNIGDVIATPTKWFFYNDETDMIDNTLGSFVAGPSTAPLGVGSAQMSVTGTQRRNIATYQFKDVKLSDITQLEFSTYSQLTGDGSLGLSERAPYLQFNVDFNNTDTWQKRLVYVPAVNGAVVSDTWQAWDAIDGGNALWMYSGATWPTTSDAGTTPKTWSQILALYPNAETRSTDSWFGFRVGEPYNNGFTGNVDKVVVGTVSGTTTFDFDPILPSVPTIVSPSSNVCVTSAQQQLIDWTDSTGTGPISYKYEAYSDANYTNLVYASGLLSVSEIPTPGTPNGTYYVRVRSQDMYGNMSDWSNGPLNPHKITVSDTFTWSPLLSPLDIAGKTFKRGSTIPVKFQILDACGKGVNLGTPTLIITGPSPSIVVDPLRYDASTGQYISNWSTKTPTLLPVGDYTITIGQGSVPVINGSIPTTIVKLVK